MNINNKLLLEETKTGHYVIWAEGECYVIAEVMEATPEVPEEADRARRMIECYNLFLGIENPTEHFKNKLYY